MKFEFTATAQALGLCALVAATMPSKSYAGWFGDHPRYLHALSDMRYAKSLIMKPDEPNVVADERAAVNELNAAIGEISEAAQEDWKPVNDHPAPDAALDRPGRLHEAIQVLNKAQQDLSQEEDNGFARGLRNRAIKHLEIARNFVRKAVGDKEMDSRL